MDLDDKGGKKIRDKDSHHSGMTFNTANFYKQHDDNYEKSSSGT